MLYPIMSFMVSPRKLSHEVFPCLVDWTISRNIKASLIGAVKDCLTWKMATVALLIIQLE